MILISVSQVTAVVNYPLCHKALHNIDSDSVGQSMVLNTRLVGLLPVQAVYLRAGLDDPCGSLPSQNNP